MNIVDFSNVLSEELRETIKVPEEYRLREDSSDSDIFLYYAHQYVDLDKLRENRVIINSLLMIPRNRYNPFVPAFPGQVEQVDHEQILNDLDDEDDVDESLYPFDGDYGAIYFILAHDSVDIVQTKMQHPKIMSWPVWNITQELRDLWKLSKKNHYKYVKRFIQSLYVYATEPHHTYGAIKEFFDPDAWIKPEHQNLDSDDHFWMHPNDLYQKYWGKNRYHRYLSQKIIQEHLLPNYNVYLFMNPENILLRKRLSLPQTPQK